jgi:hypothetical protein
LSPWRDARIPPADPETTGFGNGCAVGLAGLPCEDELLFEELECDDVELLGEDELECEEVVVAVLVTRVGFFFGADVGRFFAGGWVTGCKAEFVVVGVLTVEVVAVELVAARFGDPLPPQAAVPSDSRTETRTVAVSRLCEDRGASDRGAIVLIDCPFLG